MTHEHLVKWHLGTGVLQMLNVMDIIIGFESPASAWTNGNNQGICPQPSFAVSGDSGYCSGTAKNPKYCISGTSVCKCEHFSLCPCL